MSMDSEVNFEHDRTQALAGGSEAFRTRSWRNAFTLLSAADRQSPLEPEHMLLISGGLAYRKGTGRRRCPFAARIRHFSRRAKRACCKVRFLARIYRTAEWRISEGNWLAFPGSPLLQDQPDCVETGYLLLPNGYRAVHSGEPIAAQAFFQQGCRNRKTI